MKTGLLLFTVSLSAFASAQTPLATWKGSLPGWGVRAEKEGWRFQLDSAPGVWIGVRPATGDLQALVLDSAREVRVSLGQKELVDSLGGRVVMGYGASPGSEGRSLILSGAPTGKPEVVTLYAQDEATFNRHLPAFSKLTQGWLNGGKNWQGSGSGSGSASANANGRAWGTGDKVDVRGGDTKNSTSSQGPGWATGSASASSNHSSSSSSSSSQNNSDRNSSSDSKSSRDSKSGHDSKSASDSQSSRGSQSSQDSQSSKDSQSQTSQQIVYDPGTRGFKLVRPVPVGRLEGTYRTDSDSLFLGAGNQISFVGTQVLVPGAAGTLMPGRQVKIGNRVHGIQVLKSVDGVATEISVDGCRYSLTAALR